MKNSSILKTICYLVMPILALNIIINSFSIVYYDEYKADIEGKITYFQTQRFANNYFRTINAVVYDYYNQSTYDEEGKASIVIYEENIKEEFKKDREHTSIVSYEQENGINYIYNRNKTYDYLIIDKTGKAFTNITKTLATDTIEELKDYVKNKSYFWNYENNTVSTNIEKMTFENIAYNSYFEQIRKTGFTIYTAIENENSNEFYKYNLVYELVSSTYEYASVNIAISLILLIGMFIYIITSIGHKKGVDGIYLNTLDEIPLEIVGIISGLLLIIEIVLLQLPIKTVINYTSISNRMIDTMIGISLVIGISLYTTIVITGVTIVRRIKAKVFWKNTCLYKFINWVQKGASDLLFSNTITKGKVIAIFIIFIWIQFLLMLQCIGNFIGGAICLIIFWGISIKILLNRINKINELKSKIKDIYDGNKNSIPLETEKFNGELKEVAIQLNDIAGGLSNAIEEAMKSERLKTELITNVSHDIKTPLTSIINYIDLIKQENIKNEKIKEYLQILDNKSQRLKKLTEDLVEASKASSGNIKLNIEKLNVKELIKQVGGEFEDKFTSRKLELIESLPEEEIYIEADSRYMFRVLENMYVNISKYALEDSRVYIDVKKDNDVVKIELKNISQDKLNISVDELMQRFVRGDSARTTEGSGLGISIAKSLTELQKGKFSIYLDGDLFKVVIEFKVI